MSQPIDPALQRYYEDVLALFQQPGWKALVDDLTALRDKLNSVRECSNLERAKGEVGMLDHFLNLPGIFDFAYKQVQAEAAGEQVQDQ